MINKVEICGVNTSKLPILSNEEKKELLEKIKKHLAIVWNSMVYYFLLYFLIWRSSWIIR